ncbi:unnamed protein product [Tilletia controversa]|nr:unnamed protein product [Tilletia controversa]CAD6903717.1 unnamed protein product [Tilletia controversa]CAD6932048.1 unnamed protein product [Tilletia controversa]CAD6973766.1 unnamed protein product [Tilletia controversa]
MNRGWITWADVLWLLSSSTTGRFYPPSWPLGPPSPSASYTNHHPRPGMNLDTKGPGLGQMWSAFWRALPAGLRSRLLLAQHLPFAPSREPAGRLSSAATPLLTDAASLAFPRVLLRVHGTRLGFCTTRATRLAQSPSAVIIPDWHSDPPVPPSAWTTVWKELHDVPLPSTAISDCYLFLQRRAWLAKGPVRRNRHAPSWKANRTHTSPALKSCASGPTPSSSSALLPSWTPYHSNPSRLLSAGKPSRLTDTGSSSGAQPSSTTSPPFAAPPSHDTAKEVSFTSPSRPLPPLHLG